ncbi:MAG: hypothetical protein ACTSV5_11520 [Promethearchaeota archaeon]
MKLIIINTKPICQYSVLKTVSAIIARITPKVDGISDPTIRTCNMIYKTL